MRRPESTGDNKLEGSVRLVFCVFTYEQRTVKNAPQRLQTLVQHSSCHVALPLRGLQV